MSYRKIKIDETEYRYTTGKKYTKVVDQFNKISIFENVKIGTPILNVSLDKRADMLDQTNFDPPLDEVRNFVKWTIGPRNVKNAILGLGRPTFTCKEHNVNTMYKCYDYFEMEIHSKRELVKRCIYCQYNSWLDT